MIRATGAPNGAGRLPVEIDGEPFLLGPDDLLMTADGRLVTVSEALNNPRLAETVQRTATDEEQARLADRETSSTGAEEPRVTGELEETQTSETAAEPAPAASAPAPAASADAASAASETDDDPDFDGVPPNAEVWRIDGKIYLTWEIIDPRTGERAGLVGWHVTTMEDWEQIIAGGQDGTPDFDGTLDQAEALGFIDAGIEAELGEFSSDPLETFYEDYEELFGTSPVYGDPEMLALLIIATLEGGEVTTSDLSQTDYWKERTEAQRAWDTLALQDPATARQQRTENRMNVRQQLMSFGYVDAPDSLVNYLADKWTTGEWSETQMQMQLRAEVDPYAANASPFAGIYDWSALGDYRVVTDGEGYWVQTEDGYFALDGEGQVARFADQATEIQTKVDGEHVLLYGEHYLRTADGRFWHATGPGQIAGLERLYGPASESGHYGRDAGPPPIAGEVKDLFGGAGGIETVGEFDVVGTAGDLAAASSGGRQTTQLGGEEEVRNLLRTYVGPYHASNYSDEWVAEWAGRIRNGPPGTQDLLVQELQRSFRSMFPGYDENDFYESVASPARGLWSRYSGNAVDENDAAFLQFLQLGPDAVNREGWLRSHGRQNGWAPVVQEALSGLGQAFGPQVSRDLATGVY